MLDAAIDTTYYIGLSVSDPLFDGSGTVEPDIADGYTRQPITQIQWTNATEADPSVKGNGVIIEFPEAIGDWAAGQNIAYAVLFTQETGGVFIGSGTLSQAKSFLAGDTPRFNVGAISIELS